MKKTSVPGAAASAAKSSASASCPATTVTCEATPRCVTGIPAADGHRRERRDAGDDLDRDTGRGERERLLAAAAEHERVAALEPDDVEALARRSSTSSSFTPGLVERRRGRSRARRSGASATSSGATRRSCTSTSQARTSSRPRAVISPGSPGPAPTRRTVIASASSTSRSKYVAPLLVGRAGSASPRAAARAARSASSACSGPISLADLRRAAAARAPARRPPVETATAIGPCAVHRRQDEASRAPGTSTTLQSRPRALGVLVDASC